VYSVAVKRDGFKTWTNSLTVRDGERQTINVALEREEVAVAPAPIEVKPAEPAPVEVKPEPQPEPEREPKTDKTQKHRTHADKSADKKSTTTTATTTTTGPEPEPEPVKPEVKPETKPETKVETVTTPPKPDTQTVTAQKPARTPVVPNAAVTKLSGDMPMPRSGAGGDVSTKLCIDEQGHVTSVKVLSGPPSIAADVQRALMSWRYKPYVNRDGKPSAVCVLHSLRVVVKP
jgi:hypothetical protein